VEMEVRVVELVRMRGVAGQYIPVGRQIVDEPDLQHVAPDIPMAINTTTSAALVTPIQPIAPTRRILVESLCVAKNTPMIITSVTLNSVPRGILTDEASGLRSEAGAVARCSMQALFKGRSTRSVRSIWCHERSSLLPPPPNTGNFPSTAIFDLTELA
jgi:hypothetical protein